MNPFASGRAARRAGLTALSSVLAAGLLLAPLAAAAHKPRHVHRAASTATLYVDLASRGGRCSDARVASAVTPATPWCTLVRAAAAAPAGSRVLVRQAVYPRLTLTDSHPAAPVSYEACPGERPSLPGIAVTRSSGFRFTGFLFTAESDLTSVSDFAFTGIEVAPPFLGPRTDSGFVITGGRSGTWDHVTIHDAWNGVQFRWGGAQDIVIRDSTFRSLGDDGVDLEGAARVRILHNDFVSVHARADMDPTAHSDAVQLLGPGDDVRFDGNAISGGRGFILQFSPVGERIAGGALTHVVVVDNVFAGPDFAVRAFSTPGLRIINNTVWGPRIGAGNGIDLRGGVLANAPTTGVVLVNNIIRQLSAEPSVTFAAADHNLVIAGPATGGAATTSAISSPPTFAGLTTLDFHLVAGSPGVDGGTAALAPPTDRDGRLRNGAPDLGAYELGGAFPPAPAAVAATTAPRVPSGARNLTVAAHKRALRAKRRAALRNARRAARAKALAKRRRAHRRHRA